MKPKKNKKISTYEKIKNALSNGLFLFAFRNWLAGKGVDIRPYYWVQEEVEPCEVPKIKNDSSKFTVRELTIEEVVSINEGNTSIVIEDTVRDMENGQLCIGLETNGEIAAYNFVELNEFEFKGRVFKLKSNEAYLLNMWTFHEYRGKNLAPYLRYQSYRFIEKYNRNIKYSITDSFNKSSIRFKKKLNSKHLIYYLSVVLFKKYTWNFTLKKYK